MKRIRSESNAEFVPESYQFQKRVPPAQRGGVPVIDQVKVEEYLISCKACKKEFAKDDDRYMYMLRDFCAFCSKECRDTMIKLDEAFEKAEAATAAAKPPKKSTNGKVIWEF